MAFSSYIFIFIFLPIVLIGYYLLSGIKSRKIQNSFLLIASFVFYGYANISYLPIIIVSILVNYVLALIIFKYRDNQNNSTLNSTSKKYSHLLFIAGVIFNVGILGFYKYHGFFISNLNAVFATDFVFKTILLPLGISFFTLQQLLYLQEVYKGTEKVETILDYALFVTFFPQLIAGPIVKYSFMMPHFHEEKQRYINYDNVAQGMFIFCIGLFKKIVIADSLAIFANNGFASAELTCAAAWAAALSFTLQIYFDFSGYSDMAIGLGKMLNINIPVNFNSPYKSANVSEFWRRWHITLMLTLRDLVYIPMGGNRKGLARTCFNLLLTFFVSGLWHGAAWTFVIWGVLHGILVVLERIFKRSIDRIPNILKIAGTFFCVNALWVLFRATSFNNAMMVYKGMFNFKNIGINGLVDIAHDGIVYFPDLIWIAYIIGALAVLLVIVFKYKNSLEIAAGFRVNNKWLAIVVFLFVISVVHLSRLNTFIYFNF